MLHIGQQMKGFRDVMSRDRWQIIWMFFHVSDNSTNVARDHPNHDPISKVRPVVDKLITKFCDLYYPEKELAVDESLIAFKGRSSMGQYMPQKPHKWGLKAWVLSESSTGYCYNWSLYMGRKERAEVGLSTAVVMQLCDVVKDAGHHVYMDNFFSSPELFQSLSECSIGACGTLRANRRGTPPQIQKAKLKKGDDPILVRDNKCLFISWMDKKQVTVLTTINNTRMMTKYVRCKDPANNNRREINKPKAIECYNQYMGGVDLLDQKIWTYLGIHRTVKWWKKVFLYLLELAFVNFTIVWKRLHPNVKLDKYKLRLSIIASLVATHDRATTAKPRYCIDDVPTRLENKRHFTGINNSKTKSGSQAFPDCVVCSDRKVPKGRHQTQYTCKQCDKPMCPYPCFERYHTLLNFKIQCSKDLHKL